MDYDVDSVPKSVESICQIRLPFVSIGIHVVVHLKSTLGKKSNKLTCHFKAETVHLWKMSSLVPPDDTGHGETCWGR